MRGLIDPYRVETVPLISRAGATVRAWPLAHARSPSVRFVYHVRPGYRRMAHAVQESVMLMTVEAFMARPETDFKEELVRGEVRVSPAPGAPHGAAIANLLARLITHVHPRKLGWVFGDGFGYQLVQFPHTVRIPDASFVRSDRWPSEGVGRGLIQFAPDLAVEVLSPSETASELQEKIDDYQLSGTTLLWVLDPVRRAVTVLARNAPLRQLHEGDTLDGGDVLPEFSCPVSDLFDGISRDLRRG